MIIYWIFELLLCMFDIVCFLLIICDNFELDYVIIVLGLEIVDYCGW